MQSNTNSSEKPTIPSAPSSWKNLRSAIYRHWPAFIFHAQLTFLTVVSATRKLSKPYKTWLGRTSAFTSILILDQMILRSYSIPLDFWYPHVVAVTFCSTTLLWLLVVLEGKVQQMRSTISSLVSK